MKALITALLLMVAIFLIPIVSHSQTPFEFPETGNMFITQLGEDHYLVVEDILVNDGEFWGVWQLNKTSGFWDLILAGVPTPGDKSAFGKYFYDPDKNILIWNVTFSTFLGCAGPEAGISVEYTEMNEPVLRLTPIEFDADEDEIDFDLELERISGNPGQIVGQWSLNLFTNTYIFDFKADGTFSVQGNVQTCLMD